MTSTILTQSPGYDRDPDGYCWPCSPRLAHIKNIDDRFDWLITTGDSLAMCDRCPFAGKLIDRQLGIGNMPLMAMRKQYLVTQAMVMNIVEAAGHEAPEFRQWPRDPQTFFWRLTNELPQIVSSIERNIDWQALKAKYDLRTEWESHYGPCATTAGERWKTYCPFHNGDLSETHMVVYDDHYHCYQCQAHGTVYDVLKVSGRLAAAIGGI